MSREKESYRPILADLLQAKDGRMWRQKEIALYLGIDPRTVKSRYGIGREGVEVHDLARLLAR